MPDVDSDNPTLAIITPVYNAAAFLPRTLASFDNLAPASRRRTQLILIDDGSTDDSPALVDRFREERSDEFARIAVIHKENGGSASARNAGLDAATADWLLFLDADDELIADPLPDIQRTSPHTTAIAYAAQRFRFGKNINTHRPRRLHRKPLDMLTAENPFWPSCLVFRADLATHQFDESIISREDWLYWLQNHTLLNALHDRTDLALSRIHIHGQNKSANHARAGKFRAAVAQRILKQLQNQLSRKQKNNLRLQVACGMAVQGQWPSLADFARFPVAPDLYLKFLIYATTRQRFGRLDAYQSQTSSKDVTRR